MASGPSRPEGETQQSDTALASDDTVQHDSSQPTPAHVSTGPRIRVTLNAVAPEKLGRYVIARVLGQGGMGAVYEAEDPALGRRVAVKVLREDRHDAQFTDGLQREAQALAKLEHPNVVSVYDVGFDGGRVFVVMQMIDGESIDRWLRERKARAPQIIAAFRAAGRGLAAAHTAGLVHCDFKPANVLADRDGVVRVSDFGLARFGAGGEGSVAGTPRYMAPEQFTGVATAASDQYSFCVALCEVLLGKSPFAQSGILDVEAARTRPLPQFPRSAGVPTYVVRALHRGLAREPEQRFPSMDALLAALAPPAWRRWALAGGAGAVVLGGTVIATSALSSSRVEQRATVPDAGVVGMPDLGAARVLTQYGTSACAYAPSIDGDHVVFDRTEGDAVDLYTVPLAGGTPRQLTSAPTWEWRSNPGRHPGEVVHLIHDTKDIDKSKIAYLDVATGRETIVSNELAKDAVVTTAGIVFVAAEGGELRKLDGNRNVVLLKAPDGLLFEDLAVSHRGDRVAAIGFSAHARQLCIVDATTATPDCIALGTGDKLLPVSLRPAFGADDQRVYYVAKDGIRRIDLATRADTLVVPDVLPFGGLAVPADGRSLLYSDCGPHTRVVDWTARPPTTLVDATSGGPASGVSSKRFVWQHRVRGVSVLVVRTEDGKETQITDPERGAATMAAMSPDGTMVAYRAGSPHPGIFVTSNSFSDSAMQISDNPDDTQPVWIGNSEVAFARGDARTSVAIYAAHYDGTMLHQLPGNTRLPVGGRGHELLVATRRGLYWIDVARGTERAGPEPDGDGGQFPTASPDGRWLVFSSGTAGQLLHRMPLDPPGKVENLAPLGGGETLLGVSITNDGHVLAAPQTWSGDIHVVPAQAGSRF
jgi:serine/threonine-protein kinase